MLYKMTPSNDVIGCPILEMPFWNSQRKLEKMGVMSKSREKALGTRLVKKLIFGQNYMKFAVSIVTSIARIHNRHVRISAEDKWTATDSFSISE